LINTFSLPIFSSISAAGSLLPVMKPLSLAPRRVVRTCARHVEWLDLPSFSEVGWRTTGVAAADEEGPAIGLIGLDLSASSDYHKSLQRRFEWWEYGAFSRVVVAC
jgi:hypothetical protein